MKFPDGERQDKWIRDYIAPILIKGDIGEVISNYRKNKRESFERKMEDAGVYASLQKLEREGTSWEKVHNPLVAAVTASQAHLRNGQYKIDFEQMPSMIGSLFGEDISFLRNLNYNMKLTYPHNVHIPILKI